MLLFLLAAIALVVVNALRATETPDSSPQPPPTHAYEGSSGMGADGFGGWQSKPKKGDAASD